MAGSVLGRPGHRRAVERSAGMSTPPIARRMEASAAIAAAPHPAAALLASGQSGQSVTLG